MMTARPARATNRKNQFSRKSQFPDLYTVGKLKSKLKKEERLTFRETNL